MTILNKFYIYQKLLYNYASKFKKNASLLQKAGAKKPEGEFMSLRHYETMFILKPTLTDEEKAKSIENIQNVIKENGGEVAVLDKIGVRELAYPIAKFERGDYNIVYYKAPASAVLELERQMRYNEDLLRFMTVKYENKKEIKRWEEMVKNV
jgi:small subunit ribosomal protein S6